MNGRQNGNTTLLRGTKNEYKINLTHEVITTYKFQKYMRSMFRKQSIHQTYKVKVRHTTEK